MDLKRKERARGEKGARASDCRARYGKAAEEIQSISPVRSGEIW